MGTSSTEASEIPPKHPERRSARQNSLSAAVGNFPFRALRCARPWDVQRRARPEEVPQGAALCRELQERAERTMGEMRRERQATVVGVPTSYYDWC